MAQAAPAQAPAEAAKPQTLPPQRTETINFDNWILTCREPLDAPKKRSCAMTVSVQKSDTNQTLLSWSIQPNDAGQMMALVQTPSGVSIAPGIQLTLENAAARTIPFQVCEPNRCAGSVPLDKVFAKEVAAASKVTIVVQSSDGRAVKFEFPIKGFEKAYAKM